MHPKKETIKEARIAYGLTQTEACEMLYVTRSTWAKWESGENQMSKAYWELFNIKARQKANGDFDKNSNEVFTAE